jgi:hypothetical protein
VSKKRIKPDNLKNDKMLPYLPIAVLTAVAGFLFVAPFSKGLFNGGQVSFEGPIYNTFLFSAILLGLIAIHMFQQRYSLVAEKSVAALYVWLIPATYLVSTIQAASMHSAVNAVYINISHATFFLAAMIIAEVDRLKKYLLYALLAAGSLIVIFGLMNWFGDATLWGLITYPSDDPLQSERLLTYRDAVMVTNDGVRLTSVFQYANSYAGFLISLYLAAMVKLVSSEHWKQTLWPALMLAPVLLSMFLTLSRGGYLILPIVFVLILPLLSLARQVMATLYTVVAAGAAALTLNPITAIGHQALEGSTASEIFRGWALTIGGSVLSATIIVLAHLLLMPRVRRFLATFENNMKILSRFGLPGIFAVAGGFGLYLLLSKSGLIQLLPADIAARVTNINLQTHSVLERGTFYSDALKMIKDFPFLGAGGGGWSAMYEMYQNNPYTSRQAHNFILQYIIETGLVGFAVFILLFGWIIIRYLIKHGSGQSNDSVNTAFFAFMLGLTVHSIIDFDMSYVYLSALLFLCLGVLASDMDRPLQRLNRPKIASYVKVVPIIMLIGAACLLFASINKAAAYHAYTAAVEQAQKNPVFQIIQDKLQSAINKQPHHPTYNLQLSVMYMQVYKQTEDHRYLEKAGEIIERVYKRQPYSRDVYIQRVQLAELEGDQDALLQLTEHYLSIYPWDISLYERAAMLHYERGMEAKESGQMDVMEEHWEAIRSIIHAVEEKVAHLQTLPEGQFPGRPFEMTSTLEDILAEIE